MFFFCLDKHLKAGVTVLEGLAFEFITGYDALTVMGQELKGCICPSRVLPSYVMVIAPVARVILSHITDKDHTSGKACDLLIFPVSR